jgi:hypothetical protein
LRNRKVPKLSVTIASSGPRSKQTNNKTHTRIAGGEAATVFKFWLLNCQRCGFPEKQENRVHRHGHDGDELMRDMSKLTFHEYITFFYI